MVACVVVLQFAMRTGRGEICRGWLRHPGPSISAWGSWSLRQRRRKARESDQRQSRGAQR